MKLLSLLYLSRSTIPAAAADEGVAAIVATSHARNPVLGLTGALLFTGEYFAQVIEGKAAAVDHLMGIVANDARHDGIIVVAREPIAARRFGDWSMAYSGPSQFVAQHVTRLLAGPSPREPGRSARWLNELLWEFAEGTGTS